MSTDNTVSAPMTLKQAKANLAKAYNTYQFFAASKSNKRILIAQDVIAQLKAKQLVAQSGTYIEPSESESNDACTVCALGACFVVTSSLHDESYDKYGVFGRDTMDDRLIEYFSRGQLDLIESAFERTPMMRDSYDDDRYFQYNQHNSYVYDDHSDSPRGDSRTAIGRAINFGRQYNDDRKRLEAIMQNIIDNDGTFKPGNVNGPATKAAK